MIEGGIALILIFVLSVYMLLYGERIGAAVRGIVPRGDGTPGDDYPTRVQRAVFGYVRGQLLFSLIMGTSAGVALYVMGSLGIFPEGKTYALVFGAWYGFAELIPYVGPSIGAAPAVLISRCSAATRSTRSGSRSCSPRCSRSRVTSSRRRSSPRRCASTRCS